MIMTIKVMDGLILENVEEPLQWNTNDFSLNISQRKRPMIENFWLEILKTMAGLSPG